MKRTEAGWNPNLTQDTRFFSGLTLLYLGPKFEPLENAMKRFVSGLVLGIVLSAGVVTVTAQNERAMHPRIAKAIEALKDARAYMEAAPHDFGGHKAEAIRATDDAIKQLNLALAYRAKEDRKK
jgi:hypothetical protein